MSKAPPIKHVGIMRALCDRRKLAMLRTDLTPLEYRRLGGVHHLKGEERYTVCSKCIKLTQDWRFLTWGKRRAPKNHRASTNMRDK